MIRLKSKVWIAIIFWSSLFIIMPVLSMAGTPEKHSQTIIAEAELRDLFTQVNRGIKYGLGKGWELDKEQEELTKLKEILERLRILLRVKEKHSPKRPVLDYTKIDKELKQGRQIAEEILTRLVKKAKEEYDWFVPGKYENEEKSRRVIWSLSRIVCTVSSMVSA